MPWVGFAFLESPGNALDGIDNDGDGIDEMGGGRLITMNDFTRFVAEGEEIVLIDYESDTYERTLTTMPDTGIWITYLDTMYQKKPNVPLVEVNNNGIDDNLNGLIDESDGAQIEDENGEVVEEYYLYLRDPINNNQDYLSVNYFTGEGKDNLMIDERRLIMMVTGIHFLMMSDWMAQKLPEMREKETVFQRRAEMVYPAKIILIA